MFNPDFLRRLEGFEALRFMDWMETNDSEQSGWADRPRVTDYTYSLRGVPAEVMLDLANLLGADAWFNMPHLADDDYIRRFATLVRNGLWTDLTAYVEFPTKSGTGSSNRPLGRPHGAGALEPRQRLGAVLRPARQPGGRDLVRGLWRRCRGPAGQRDSTQTGWLGLEKDILDPPLLRQEQPDRAPVHSFFDAYAITGYFGHALGQEDRAPMVRDWIADSRAQAEQAAEAEGLTGAARDSYVAAHQYDVATAWPGPSCATG